MRQFLVITVLGLAMAQGASSQAYSATSSDVLIYGCTPAGITAALEVRRHGHSVQLLCPGSHIGGLSANGLGFADAGDHDAVGGQALQFYRDVKAYYTAKGYTGSTRGQTAESQSPVDRETMWIFEPHVAEAIYTRWLSDAGVKPVFRQALLLDTKKGVEKDGARIRKIHTVDGHTYAGRVFIDATYEGDLLAMAGVSYTIGREANAVYGETLNGIQAANSTNHQFVKDIDPYVVPGNPASGLLPRISAEPPGQDGDGDQRIQAYNYRLCMTKDPGNRVAFRKPDNYDPQQYEVLGRYLDAGFRGPFGIFAAIPHGKTDTNNYGAFSTDDIGMNYSYPTGSYAEREKIAAEHRSYQEGFFWFLQHDPRVPMDVREATSAWGLCADEFTDNGNWPHELYIREGRRMVSDFVMTENHLRGSTPTPEPVGLGSYNLDSHNSRRYVDAKGHVRNEGNIEVSPGRVYEISYRAIVPKENEASNLLVPVAVSASHIAYGSIRMEPVFMILGQSAGAAASLSLEEGVPVQAISYDKLRGLLLDEGQHLTSK
ncbi:hypothetical protein AEAC466_18070 [Asticcacaulis sp. AC466]|uniref:FAD-dependent oxidoreductase n=1 Tax=Asticcacaulis sp. AC466 TaxID=1282362 RepID=UPI0003C3DFF4|nr:FAD-dependent oxidoreductase [Asticcacaulis sp. AC466]ESQ82253.1 hypothetical protein AEAC466_18070 [Asticcacaulis sp. AC466]